MDYLIKTVFLIDVIIGFRKAYMNEKIGKEVRDPWLIAKRYLKFYFWIDLVSALPFDLIFRHNYAFHLLPMVKVVRLLRADKIISFMNFDAKARSRLRVFYRVMRMIIIIHWITCIFQYQTQNTWRNLTAGLKPNEQHIPWDYNYWIPQVDMARGTSEYYFLNPVTRYFVLFYYCILLTVGNDIMPSNMNEFIFCTIFLFFGAFLEAYVIGGITAEMQKSEDGRVKFEKKIEYIKFSMEIHSFPDLIKSQVIHYMGRHDECRECSGDFERFAAFLNPA